jgi:Raf kinase inhibitor-like YbhB/YbcL family protein
MKNGKFFLVILILLIALTPISFVYLNLNKNNMEQKNQIKLTSDVFENNQYIPKKYSCNDENINPPLFISNVSKETKSLVLIVDDPDAPRGDWVHWLVWNIPVNITNIVEDSVPEEAIQGLNDYGNNKYDGPCPPSGTHRYFFKLYALDTVLNLDKNSKKINLENAMKGHILDQTSLIGLYSK